MIAILFAALTLSAQAPATTWEQGLERERASLRAELTALQSALKKSEESTSTTAGALEADLKLLTARLVRLRAENESQTAQFGERERDRRRKFVAGAIVEGALRTQAWGLNRKLLDKKNKDLDPAGLEKMFSALVDGLRQRAIVSTTEGRVFDDKGIGKTERILQTGRVGAIAIDKRGKRATPVEPIFGEQGWTHVGPSQAVTTSGDWVSIPVVLFDPDAPHDHAPTPSRGLLGWLEAGGLAMYPLFLMGLIALVVSCERALRLLQAQRAWWAAAKIGGENWQTPLSSTVLAPDVLRPVRMISEAPAEDTKEDVEERAVESILRLRTQLRTRLSVLGIISAAAPLLGLLGTVTGMIGTFRVITEHGTGDPELLSDGISQALLTTQLGLAIAIPTLLSHAGLGRWAQRLIVRAEQAALILIQMRPKHEDNAE